MKQLAQSMEYSEILENSVDKFTEFINEATETNFLIENNDIINTAVHIMADENALNEPSVAVKACGDGYHSNLISIIEKNNKYYKSTLKQLSFQMNVQGLYNMDSKLQAIMKADSRVRAMTLPIPEIPTVFINILPVTSLAALETAEELLSIENTVCLLHKENLFVTEKLYSHESWDIKPQCCHKKAVKLCFDYTILGNFSFKGKTKRKFIDLEPFSVIHDF